MKNFLVHAAHAGERLDRYLAVHCPDISRSRLQHWIAAGCVCVNNAVVCSAKKTVHPDDAIVITPPAIIPTTLTPENIPLDILFEDDAIIVINKPAGLAVHPGAGRREGTLVHALLARPHGLSSIGGVERPGIVHRLDIGTSGVMIVAKTDAAHAKLSQQFQDRLVKKNYLALCYGAPADTGTIDVPIGRHPTDRKKMSTRARHARAAVTHWRVQERFARTLSLLDVTIETGRTHQIRVHLTAQKFPLVGDRVYGGDSLRARLPADWQQALSPITRPALHAWRLHCVHPTRHTPCTWEAPVPDDFNLTLTALRETRDARRATEPA